MKFRRTREVAQGASNFNSKSSLQQITRSTMRPYTATNFSFQGSNTGPVSTLNVQSHKKQPLSSRFLQSAGSTGNQFNRKALTATSRKDKVFCKPLAPNKIVKDQNCFPLPKTTVEHVISSLKNACQYKQYHYFNVFNLFDKNNNGKVTPPQIQQMIKSYGYNLSKEQSQQVVSFFQRGENALLPRTSQHKHTEEPYSQTFYKKTQQNKQTTGKFAEVNKSDGPCLQFFTLEDFINQLGQYAEPELKVTGDPLQRKLTIQRPIKQRTCTAKRNASINVKNLLDYEPSNKLLRKSSSSHCKGTSEVKSPTSQQSGLNQCKGNSSNSNHHQDPIQRRSRFLFNAEQSKFTDQVNVQKAQPQKCISKRIKSANCLIPRSTINPLTNYPIFSKAESSKISQKSSNLQIQHLMRQGDTKNLLMKDQLEQKAKLSLMYQNKLQRINQNRQDLTKKCDLENKKNHLRSRFTQNWGMLSKNNAWITRI